MRILLVTYCYEPDISPRAFRWKALVEQWLEHGHTVDVIAGPNATPVEHKTLRVFPVGMGTEGQLRQRMAQSQSLSRSKRLGLQCLRWIYSHTLRRLLWPDYARAWIAPATAQGLSLLRQASYDQIVSVSHPFSGHVVGLALKEFCPQVPWLVDIGDPFTYLEPQTSNSDLLFLNRNKRAEARVLSNCDQIVVTTPETRAQYLKHFSECRDKISSIPPLLSVTFDPLRDAPARSEKIKLTFVGTLYQHVREPNTLLVWFERLLARNPNFELHFYGHNQTPGSFANWPQKYACNLHHHGVVSRPQAQNALEHTDIVVNIGNANSIQLPSKIVECVAAGKPILHVSNTTPDGGTDLLAEHPSLFVVRGTPTETEIQNFNQFLLNPPKVDREWVKKFVTPFTPAAISNRYLTLMGPQP